MTDFDLIKLDIGCGKNKKPGFTGVDIWEGADIVWDLEQFPWPFEDSSVDEIFCSHFIEHTKDLVSFANELYRIMKIGGKAEIIAPYYSSVRAWQDPTHLRAISENTFYYFCKEWREINKLDHYPIISDFDFTYRLLLDEYWRGKSDDEIKYAIKYNINVVTDINVILTKKKSMNKQQEFEIARVIDMWTNGNYEEAQEECREIINNGFATFDIWMIAAESALKRDENEKALECFNNALSIDENSIQAHAGLIRLMELTKNISGIQQHMTKLRSRNSELANTLESFLELK